ncbi:hypothetical protein ABFX02_04G063500 [Erythranthe guttata]
MADFFLQNFKQSFSLEDFDPGSDFVNQFSGLNHSLIGSFPHDSIFPQLSPGPGNLDNFPGLFIHDDKNVAVTPFTEPLVLNNNHQKNTKRKADDISTPESSSANSSAYSSPQVSNNGIRKPNCGRRGKKAKGGNEKEDEKPRDVIHVRAKRGQATDSHSLAERVRRGKINERLRCLQDIVPGCYKTMGMAVMFDEIINYVQSLQNQVEFLSMKLTAASTYFDFNSDTYAMETMQKANAAIQGLSFGQIPPLSLDFGCYTQLPHSK